MTQKEVLNKIGLKDYIIYHFLWILEIIINNPYSIIRTVLDIIYTIFEFLVEKFEDLLIFAFREERIIRLSKISKRANTIRERVIRKLKEWYINEYWRSYKAIRRI